MSEGETIPGAMGLAIPVFGTGNVVVAAINITGPAHRWTEERMQEVLPDFLQEVAGISAQLGHLESGDVSRRKVRTSV